MNIKSSRSLVEDALKSIETLNSSEVKKLVENNEITLIDVKKMVLFCALGLRSALATKALTDMGFKNVAHVDGGFDALKKSGLKIVTKEKK